MALQPLIEYLRAQRLSGARDTPLVGHAGQQYLSPIIAAGTRTSITLSPLGEDFAAIGYHIRADKGVVLPNVFAVNVFQAFQQVISATITESLIEDGLDTFLVVTRTYPVRFELVNLDPNNAHEWANHIFFLTVGSEAGLQEVYKRIEYYASAGTLVGALERIERALAMSAAAPPARTPPLYVVPPVGQRR